MDGSLSEFLQMAQVSAQMSQDHMQTCVDGVCDGAFPRAGRALPRRARDGGGASLGGGQPAAFVTMLTGALSETMRARRGRRVIQHSIF